MKIRFFYVIFFLPLFFSCTKETREKRELDEEVVTSTIDEINSIVRDIKYLFPTPGEVLGIIKEAGLGYDESLLNSPKNYSSYSDLKQQYSNLGIYLTDMVYCTFMNQPNKSVEYLGAIKKMGMELRSIPPGIDEIVKRAENNINNVDSLVQISNSYYMETIQDLQDRNMHKAIAMISAGAYIEVLYLASQSVGEYSDTNSIITKILQQRYVFDNLKNYVGVFKENELAKDTYIQLLEIKNAYLQFGTEKEETVLQKRDDGVLLLGGGTKLIVTEKDFNNLCNKVEEIRNSIVKIDD